MLTKRNVHLTYLETTLFPWYRETPFPLTLSASMHKAGHRYDYRLNGAPDLECLIQVDGKPMDQQQGTFFTSCTGSFVDEADLRHGHRVQNRD